MFYKEQPNDFVPDIQVVGCLVEHNGKILLLHRHNHKSQGGRWGIPAGKMDEKDNNSIITTALRELYEETGLMLEKDDLKFYKTFFVEYPEKKYFYHYHKAKIGRDFDVIIEPHEHQGYTWVTVEEALSMPLVDHEADCLKDYYGIK